MQKPQAVLVRQCRVKGNQVAHSAEAIRLDAREFKSYGAYG
jgi:hypothetical protein